MSQSQEVVYEGWYKQPGHGGKKRIIRMMVSYNDGGVFVLRTESENRHPTRVLLSRFVEPDDDDWRAGHGVAFEQGRRHLEDVLVMMGSLGYVEEPGSPGWLIHPKNVFRNYLFNERERHPLPVMH